MPKKTKKEKIITDLRRKLEMKEVEHEKLDNEARNLDVSIRRNPLITSKIQHIPPQNQASRFRRNAIGTFSFPTSSYIIRDLRKTFLLAGLAISFELVLYLVWR